MTHSIAGQFIAESKYRYQSARYNPVLHYTRPSEIADRVALVLPRGGERRVTASRVPSASSPMFMPCGGDLGSRREVPEFPEELLPRELSPQLRVALRAGWVLSFSLSFREEEFCHLDTEVRENPSLEGIRLDLERPPGCFYRRAVWIHAVTSKTYPKMTDRLMRELRVRQGARPVLALKELKRRRIARLQEAAAKALRAIRESCGQAQVEVAKGLAQAKGFLLLTATPALRCRETSAVGSSAFLPTKNRPQ